VVKHILGLNNEPVSQLQEVLSVEGHLWAQPSWRIDLGDLDELPVDGLHNDLVLLLSSRWKGTRSIQGISERRETIQLNAH